MRAHLHAISRFPQTMEGRQGFLCMDRNERIDPFPPEVWEAIVAQLTPEMMCHYPDGSTLVEKLAEQEKLLPSQVYLTNGSDAALRMLFQAFLEPGGYVIAANPTYAMVSVYSEIFEGRLKEISYGADRKVSIDDLRFAIDSTRAKLVVLANPDQPTGAILSRKQLLKVAESAAKNGGLLVVDEAYYPFYPESAVNLVQEGFPVAVTRSFSKWMGIPGLRLGYLLGSAGVVDAVQKIRGAHEVNGVAISVGTYLMDHPEVPSVYAAELEEGREALQKLGEQLGYDCPPCPANFQLLNLRTNERATALADLLKLEGILVKGSFNESCLASCIRVTLGGRKSMDRLLETLKSVWKDLPL